MIAPKSIEENKKKERSCSLIREKRLTSIFQESALLSIMHCQHDKRFSLVVLLLVNFFSFLPHILQQLPPLICNCCCFFFILENILIFAAAAMSQSSKIKVTAKNYHKYYCGQNQPAHICQALQTMLAVPTHKRAALISHATNAQVL